MIAEGLSTLKNMAGDINEVVNFDFKLTCSIPMYLFTS